MTTGQLIVLWYAALAIVIILIFKALEDAHDSPYLIYSIITFAAVLIYTMREHARANKKLVLVSVLMPFVAITCLGLGYLTWSNYQYRHRQIHISPSQVHVQHFRIARLPGEILAPEAIGRINNLSQNLVKRVTLRFRFTNGERSSAQYTVFVDADTEPGNVSDFNVPVAKDLIQFLDEPEVWPGMEVEVSEVIGTRTDPSR